MTPKVRHLVKANRVDFVKACPQAAGLSVWRIHQEVLAGTFELPKGWALAPKRVAVLEG